MKNLFFILLFFSSNVSFAQNCNGFENFPLGENAAKVFYDSLKNECDKENYQNALKLWEQLYVYSPLGDKKQYVYGVEIYTSLIINKKNDRKNNSNYEKKIIHIYENHLACLNPKKDELGKILESMAYSLSEIGYSDYERTRQTYQKAVKTNGNETSAYIMAYYADHVIWMYENDLTEKETARNVYKQLEKIKDANSDDSEYEEVWIYVEQYYDEAFLINPTGCIMLEEMYRPIYEKNKNDKALIQQILQKLDNTCNYESEFAKELKVALAKK